VEYSERTVVRFMRRWCPWWAKSTYPYDDVSLHIIVSVRWCIPTNIYPYDDVSLHIIVSVRWCIPTNMYPYDDVSLQICIRTM